MIGGTYNAMRIVGLLWRQIQTNIAGNIASSSRCFLKEVAMCKPSDVEKGQ